MPRRPDTSPQTLLVFQALLRQPNQWRYGYDLSKETGLKSGTLYPILIRLTNRGLLETHWQQPERPGRPARHVYRLTSEGERVAHRQISPAHASRQWTGAHRPAEGSA
jgi:PadR family transcriptional regulator, regulatory protein PadR